VQQLRRDNIASIVTPRVKQGIESLDCEVWFKRLSYAEVLKVREVASLDAEGGDSWPASCDIVQRATFDGDTDTPLFDTAEDVQGLPVAVVTSLIIGLLEANGLGKQEEATDEAVKND